MDLEAPVGPAAQDRFGGLLRCDQRRHREFVACRQRCRDEARTDQADADPLVPQIQVQGFREIDQGRLGRTVSKAFRQPAIAGDAAHQADVTGLPSQKMGQHRVEHVQRTEVVDLLVPQHLRQVEAGRPLFGVIAGAVQHRVEVGDRQNVPCRAADGVGIGHIHRKRECPWMLFGELAQRRLASSRHDHPRPGAMQRRCGRPPDAAGCADQPHRAAYPVPLARIQRREPAGARRPRIQCGSGVGPGSCLHNRLVKDKVTSPNLTPNLLIDALFNITRSDIRYIQSSICTSTTLPSTGSASV